MNIQISQTLTTDLLIVGSGIAGLAACVEAHTKGIRATLISKAPIGSGASYFPLKATLGIQVTGENDRDTFRAEIERVGGGRTNPHVISAYVNESPQAIELLARIGFRPWQRRDQRPACFAQMARPIYLINDWREAATRAKQIIATQHTSVFEQATLLRIVTEQNQVQGAIFSVVASGHISYLFCKTSHIVLATGGIAGLYHNNLYPADVIGSSHYVAHLAGAKLTNLAFIQFIPAFVEPKYKVLFGEHTLKYVQKITDSQGNDLFPHLSPTQFQHMMLARSHYAPFSVEMNGIELDLVMMKHLLDHPEEKGIYLHYRPEIYKDHEEFYRVYLHWLHEEVGIDLVRNRVAIAPFAHSCNGGVDIDEFGESCVNGLFAIGEISHSVEGVNRMGGNSVGAGLVLAKRAVAKVAENLQKNGKKRPLAEAKNAQKQAKIALHSLTNPNADLTLSASTLLSEIRALMSRYANVYRTRENLALLLEQLQQLESRFDPIHHHQQRGIETYHALKTAQLVVQQMLDEPSQGAHFLAT